MTRIEVSTPRQRDAIAAFSLIEILLAVFILTILLLVISNLVGHTSKLTRNDNRHFDTDSQARTVFDRMTADFDQMLKRADLDYYVKSGTIRYPGHSAGHKKGG